MENLRRKQEWGWEPAQIWYKHAKDAARIALAKDSDPGISDDRAKQLHAQFPRHFGVTEEGGVYLKALSAALYPEQELRHLSEAAIAPTLARAYREALQDVGHVPTEDAVSTLRGFTGHNRMSPTTVRALVWVGSKDPGALPPDVLDSLVIQVTRDMGLQDVAWIDCLALPESPPRDAPIRALVWYMVKSAWRRWRAKRTK